LRYGHDIDSLRSFSWEHGINALHQAVAISRGHLSALMSGGFTCRTAYGFQGPFIGPLRLASSVTPELITSTSWCGNINPLCIGYSLRPHLSSRLTPGGRTFPGKPYPYGDEEFNLVYRYLCLDSHFQVLHRHLPFRLQRTWNALLPRGLRHTYVFGKQLKSRSFSARFHSMGQLLRTV
jgi:hypothetical protein